MKVRWLLPFLLGFSVIAFYAPTPTRKHRVEGAWRIAQVTSGDGRITRSPQPGLLIFTRKHYSHMRVTATVPREAVSNTDTASAVTLLALWGNQSFIANAGSYEATANILVMRPIVAKNPGVMSANFSITYSIEIRGDSLTLLELRDSEGPAVDPPRLRFVRVE